MFYHIISDEYCIPVVEKSPCYDGFPAVLPGKGKRCNNIPCPFSHHPRQEGGKDRGAGTGGPGCPAQDGNSMGYPVPCAITSPPEDPFKLTCSFEKKTQTRKNIPQSSVWMLASWDAFHTSEGQAIESFQPVIEFYQTEVEPAFGNLSTLRNRKQQLRRFLKKHKVLPEKVILDLRETDRPSGKTSGHFTPRTGRNGITTSL